MMQLKLNSFVSFVSFVVNGFALLGSVHSPVYTLAEHSSGSARAKIKLRGRNR
jgi:hypothetical protein